MIRIYGFMGVLCAGLFFAGHIYLSININTEFNNLINLEIKGSIAADV